MPRPRGETAATGVERATSTLVRLERGGMPGTGDDGLVCQASAFGLDPGSEGQPKELLAEERTRTDWHLSKVTFVGGQVARGGENEAQRLVRRRSH